MITAKDAVIWINDDTKEVMVKPNAWGRTPLGYAETRDGWGDPIGASYKEWMDGTDEQCG